MGTALALFLASCLMYPAWAFCVLPLCFAEFCLAPARPLRRRLLRLAIQLAFFFIAAMLYYVLGRLAAWATTAVLGSMPAGEAYQLSMRLDAATLAQRATDAARQLVMAPPLSFDLPAGALPAFLIPPALILARTTRRQTGLGAPGAAALGAGTWRLGCILLLGSLSPWLFSRMEPLYTRHTLAAALFFCVGAASLPGLLLPPRLAHADTGPYPDASAPHFARGLSQHALSRLETQVSGAEIALCAKNWANGWRQGLGDTRRVLVFRPAPSAPVRPSLGWRLTQGRGERRVASSQNPGVHYLDAEGGAALNARSSAGRGCSDDSLWRQPLCADMVPRACGRWRPCRRAGRPRHRPRHPGHRLQPAHLRLRSRHWTRTSP